VGQCLIILDTDHQNELEFLRREAAAKTPVELNRGCMGRILDLGFYPPRQPFRCKG
jgi:hypothetical protein